MLVFTPTEGDIIFNKLEEEFPYKVKNAKVLMRTTGMFLQCDQDSTYDEGVTVELYTSESQDPPPNSSPSLVISNSSWTIFHAGNNGLMGKPTGQHPLGHHSGHISGWLCTMQNWIPILAHSLTT
jgi:hypothetical protein